MRQTGDRRDATLRRPVCAVCKPSQQPRPEDFVMPSTFDRRARAGLLAAAAWLACVGSAQAYVVIPEGGNSYNKWGASLSAGTPGGVVTWGFMAAGTAGSAYCGDACPGSSVLGLPNFYADPANGNTTSVLSLLDLQATLQTAFDKWSAVANVQFQFVGVDNSGLAINDPAATSPMIRVGAFSFNNSFAAAVGYSPPPNGGTGAGELLFNTAVGYQLAGGTEGSALQLFPAGGGFYMNDIKGLALHEIGHALGLLHSADVGAVMCGNPTANCSNLDQVTQQLRVDDVAGAQFLYGVAAPVPEPQAGWMALAGLGAIGWLARRAATRRS
jgi:hypothetical protein